MNPQAEIAVPPPADTLWPLLSDEERRVVTLWETLAAAIAAAPDKSIAVNQIVRDYAQALPGISRSTIYRKLAALRRHGREGLIGKASLKHIFARGTATRLPQAFVAAWQARCGSNQRGKVLTCWQDLLGELRAGKRIPGYELDWRGIWLAEHPGNLLPRDCPYVVDHRRNAHPKGWSYRNLKMLAPAADVMAAATCGVAARRLYLPSLPHTRAGLGVMEVITMDDVWHDVEVLFLQGRQMPTHERPVEVGVLDVLTGCHVAWQVWPVRRRADGSREMVDWTVQRYIQAQIFCGIGVSAKGLTQLLEHGTAGMKDTEVARINGILERYLTPPSGRDRWLTVLRSTTTGAPITRGLFCERACGNPRHKAMLESSWNLLHNALASLPAATGKDRDHAPADAQGLRTEDKALMDIVNDVAKANPDAIDILRQAEFNAVSFLRFKDALSLVKDRINHRVDHSLEGWEACGFTRAVATLPGGAELDLDALSHDRRQAAADLVKTLGAPVSMRRMSPSEAFAARKTAQPLVRFPAAAAAEILGRELAQEFQVSKRGTLTISDRFSRETLTYSALATAMDGSRRELTRAETVRVYANPFARETLLVADTAGRILGVCPLLEASRFGDADADHRNLGIWIAASDAQQKRLDPILNGRKNRAQKTRQSLGDLIGQARDAQASADAAQNLSTAANVAQEETFQPATALTLSDFI